MRYRLGQIIIDDSAELTAREESDQNPWAENPGIADVRCSMFACGSGTRRWKDRNDIQLTSHMIRATLKLFENFLNLEIV